MNKAPDSAKSDDKAAKSASAPVSPSAAGWRASNLLNATIRNNANEAVGDISDLIIDNSGKISSVIVGVGGFLGIGERLVAVSYEQLQFSRDANGRPLVKANLTKESLRSVPEWRDPNATAK